jgi:hypothetical protein
MPNRSNKPIATNLPTRRRGSPIRKAGQAVLRRPVNAPPFPIDDPMRRF